MIDIVCKQGLRKLSGINKLVLASRLSNLRIPKAPNEAKNFSRMKNALLYSSSYDLDEGICKDLHKNGGALLFSFSDIFPEYGFRRAIMLSKMRLAFASCRRNGANAIVCTMANENHLTRTAYELDAFKAVLGMTVHEKKHSDSIAKKLLVEKKASGEKNPSGAKSAVSGKKIPSADKKAVIQKQKRI